MLEGGTRARTRRKMKLEPTQCFSESAVGDAVGLLVFTLTSTLTLTSTTQWHAASKAVGVGR